MPYVWRKPEESTNVTNTRRFVLAAVLPASVDSTITRTLIAATDRSPSIAAHITPRWTAAPLREVV